MNDEELHVASSISGHPLKGLFMQRVVGAEGQQMTDAGSARLKGVCDDNDGASVVTDQNPILWGGRLEVGLAGIRNEEEFGKVGQRTSLLQVDVASQHVVVLHLAVFHHEIHAAVESEPSESEVGVQGSQVASSPTTRRSFTFSDISSAGSDKIQSASDRLHSSLIAVETAPFAREGPCCVVLGFFRVSVRSSGRTIVKERVEIGSKGDS